MSVVPVVVRMATDSGGGGLGTVQASGWVEPDPYPVAVTALTEGVVAEVLVLEGQAVKKGQTVARMVSDDAPDCARAGGGRRVGAPRRTEAGRSRSGGRQE